MHDIDQILRLGGVRKWSRLKVLFYLKEGVYFTVRVSNRRQPTTVQKWPKQAKTWGKGPRNYWETVCAWIVYTYICLPSLWGNKKSLTIVDAGIL